jgi:hypothetical protein
MEDIAEWARRRYRIPIHIIPNPINRDRTGLYAKTATFAFCVLMRFVPRRDLILIRSFGTAADIPIGNLSFTGGA